MNQTSAAKPATLGPDEALEPSIPVISVGALLANERGAREAVAEQLRYALENIGFFVVIDHDVPQTLIEQTFEQARRFHDLPSETKLALRMNEHNNGYMALGRYTITTTDVNANDKPDLNEAFFTKRERPADDPLVLGGRRFVGPNQWPAELPGFKEACIEYTDTVDRLARRLMPALSLSLELPADFFDQAFAESQFSFRLSHYPPVDAEDNQFGIAPHTDANFMTFLAQSDVPGLEVRMPSGQWLAVPYIPGSFAVNSGDMLHRWTNRRFKSTPHRAVPPKHVHRYAIPYFLGPNIDTVIECLPTCIAPGAEPEFEPITYDAYLHWWYDQNYNASVQKDGSL